MIALPLQINRRRILILILEKENIVRMQIADPIDLKTKDYFVNQVGGDDPELLICYEEDAKKVVELCKTKGLAEAVKFLERGRTIYDGERVGGGVKL